VCGGGWFSKDLVFARLTKFTLRQVLEKTLSWISCSARSFRNIGVFWYFNDFCENFALLIANCPDGQTPVFMKSFNCAHITVGQSHDILRMHRENTGTVEEARRSSSESG
jgi:hypothetical protein